MARRVIRRRRPSGTRIVRRVAPVRAAARASAVEAKPVQPTEDTGIPVLMAATNTTRNIVLPKLASMPEITLAGIADNPGTALKMLIQEHPEVVIMDMDFGGPLAGLDTGKMMQKTRARAAIVMLVSDIDPETMRKYARRFGTSWSYVKRTTAGRVDILEMVLKSASRGVQWVEPDLSRALSALWKIAEGARDLEAKNIETDTDTAGFTSKTTGSTASFAEPEPDDYPTDEPEEQFADEEVAPGIKTQSTNDDATEGLKTRSVSVGRGGIGQNVGKVRRSI